MAPLFSQCSVFLIAPIRVPWFALTCLPDRPSLLECSGLNVIPGNSFYHHHTWVKDSSYSSHLWGDSDGILISTLRVIDWFYVTSWELFAPAWIVVQHSNAILYSLHVINNSLQSLVAIIILVPWLSYRTLIIWLPNVLRANEIRYQKSLESLNFWNFWLLYEGPKPIRKPTILSQG